jgi:hypothetical protein
MLRWYDYIVIFFFADIISASIIMAFTGSFAVFLVMLPTFVFLWLMYENFRALKNNEKNS